MRDARFCDSCGNVVAEQASAQANTVDTFTRACT